MIKIKSKKNLEDGNVELTLVSDHTGEEQDFTVRVSRELLAGMTPLELKTMLMEKYKVFYREYLDTKVDKLVDPMIGVDLTVPSEPETPEEP